MKIFTKLCCAALTVAGAIYAQTPIDHMKVRLEKPIMVGETQLAAGNCDIQIMRGSSDSAILVLRSQDGQTVAAVASHMADNDSDNTEKAGLVLNRRGNDLQLSEILFGDHTGYRLNSAE